MSNLPKLLARLLRLTLWVLVQIAALWLVIMLLSALLVNYFRGTT